LNVRKTLAIISLRLPVIAGFVTLTLAGIAHAQTSPAVRFPAVSIEKGKALFERTCVQCHGRNMVNAGTTVYDLRRFPVDEPERFVQSVTKGKGNMPSFGETFAADEVKLLWAYVGSRGGKEP
jgi:cytochrome c6